MTTFGELFKPIEVKQAAAVPEVPQLEHVNKPLPTEVADRNLAAQTNDLLQLPPSEQFEEQIPGPRHPGPEAARNNPHSIWFGYRPPADEASGEARVGYLDYRNREGVRQHALGLPEDDPNRAQSLKAVDEWHGGNGIDPRDPAPGGSPRRYGHLYADLSAQARRERAVGAAKHIGSLPEGEPSRADLFMPPERTDDQIAAARRHSPSLYKPVISSGDIDAIVNTDDPNALSWDAIGGRDLDAATEAELDSRYQEGLAFLQEADLDDPAARTELRKVVLNRMVRNNAGQGAVTPAERVKTLVANDKDASAAAAAHTDDPQQDPETGLFDWFNSMEQDQQFAFFAGVPFALFGALSLLSGRGGLGSGLAGLVGLGGLGYAFNIMGMRDVLGAGGNLDDVPDEIPMPEGEEEVPGTSEPPAEPASPESTKPPESTPLPTGLAGLGNEELIARLDTNKDGKLNPNELPGGGISVTIPLTGDSGVVIEEGVGPDGKKWQLVQTVHPPTGPFTNGSPSTPPTLGPQYLLHFRRGDDNDPVYMMGGDPRRDLAEAEAAEQPPAEPAPVTPQEPPAPVTPAPVTPAPVTPQEPPAVETPPQPPVKTKEQEARQVFDESTQRLRMHDPSLNSNFGSAEGETGKPGVFDSPKDVKQLITAWMSPSNPLTASGRAAARIKPTDTQMQGYISRLSQRQRIMLYNTTVREYKAMPDKEFTDKLRKGVALRYFRRLWGALRGKKPLI